MSKKDQWDINEQFKKMDELGVNEIVEEFDAEEVCGVNGDGWLNTTSEELAQTTSDAVVANISGNLPTSTNNFAKFVKNIKYKTTEPEISLTNLTSSLGKIDNIEIINNPINAKITCENNLINVENQGIFGTIQMQVSSHKTGEAKATRIANIVVELDSKNKDEWVDTTGVFDDDYVEELNEDELEEAAGGYAIPTTTWKAPSNTQFATVKNLKYITTEPEICLTDLTKRLGNIDGIQIINNPINAKITCNNNLINVENQGVYGLVQMQVSGHSIGEAKASRTANVFVVLD